MNWFSFLAEDRVSAEMKAAYQVLIARNCAAKNIRGRSELYFYPRIRESGSFSINCWYRGPYIDIKNKKKVNKIKYNIV